MHSHDYKLNFFRCPSSLIQFILVLIISLLVGAILFPIDTDGIIMAVAIFVVPTVISMILLPNLKGYQEPINYRQSSLIALVSLGIIGVLATLYYYSSIDNKLLLVTVYAVPVSFRYLIIRSTFISHVIKSIPYALIQSLLALPLIHLYYPLNTLYIVYFSLVTLLGLSSVTAFISVVNKPFLRDFGVPTMDMMRISFQVLKGDEEGEKQLEDVFKKTSIKGDVKYTVFSFRTKKGPKALFVVPCLHPGPIKGIAGSRLTEILSEELENKYGLTFTFHGPSTHVLNPIKEDDCKLLSEDITKRMDGLEYDSFGTSFATSYHTLSVGAQMMGNGLFLTASFSPQPTEDIDSPVGEIITLRATEKGFHTTAMVDAHNCMQKGAMEVYYPSRRYQNLMDTTLGIFDEIKGFPRTTLKMGVAVKRGFNKAEGISGEGIKVAVFESDGTKNAYVLVDGNNMVQGLRESIQEEINDLVDISEVATSDSHEVNTLNRSYNPVGENMNHEIITETVRKLTEEAISDLEPIETGAFSGELNNFSLMGPIGSHRLNAVAETIYQMAPFIISMTFVIQALATTLIILLL